MLLFLRLLVYVSILKTRCTIIHRVNDWLSYSSLEGGGTSVFVYNCVKSMI